MSPADVGMHEPDNFNRTRESLEKELESLRTALERQNKEISRCEEVERSLRESEEKYRFLVENSKDIIWKIDLQGRWTFVSSNVEKVKGYKPEEVIGKTIWDFVAPNYFDIVKEKLEERVQGRGIPPYELEVVHKDGHYVPFEVLTVPIADNKGSITGIQGISRDISYRKQADAKLKKYYDELEERVEQRTAELDKARSTLQTILETAPIGIVVADAETENITYLSKGAVDIVGCPFSGRATGPEEGQFELLYPDGKPFPEDELPLVRSLRHGERVEGVEILVRRNDGGEITVLESSAPVLDPTGCVMAAASMMDITALKNALDELRDAKGQTELYLALMSHDINNMNHITMGYLEIAIDLVKLSGKLEADRLQLLEKPLDTIQNSSKLIDNVRKIQRIREGGLKLEIVDIGALLDEVKQEYSHIPGRDITINFERRDRYPVKANPLLKDVFANIVGNAIKHSQGPLTVNILADTRVQDGKKFYTVTIEDNGPGIPDAYKAELLSRKKLGGKGLGLYLVRTFVANFRGKFWIEDRVPGDRTKGAKFVIMLSAAE